MLTANTERLAGPTGHTTYPGDASWDADRQAFNLTIDQRPEAIAFPTDVEQVAAVVRAATGRDLRLTVQATGHNAGPLGRLDGTIIVNTSRLLGVTIDAEARRVRVGAGTRWGAVTPALSGLGLAALHGSSPDVGVVGYALGGGMGWLARKYGLHTNSITAIELVTAAGEPVRTDATHEPELFWALRGGGGNFGVVTAIEFEAFAVRELYAGALFFAPERAAEVFHTWHGLLPQLPDELMSWASVLNFPDLPEVPEPVRGGSFVVMMGVYLGDEVTGRRLLQPLRDLAPIMDTFAMVPPVALSELAMDPPSPVPYHGAHRLLGALPDAAIDAFVAAAAPAEGSPLAAVQLRHMGGALGRSSPGAGVRATLPGHLSLFAVGMVVDEASAQAVDVALEGVAAAVAGYEVGEYPNFVETPADARSFFSGEDWARLRRVKAQYDPTDLFRGNHHVPLAG